MHESNGWWLPDGDNYFKDFTAKGFQLDHLERALGRVKTFNVAVDVGAHIGFWTKVMATRFRAVFAFEAAEDTFHCLCRNVPDEVFKFNLAIGNSCDSVSVSNDQRRRGNTGARYVSREKVLGSRSVLQTTIDSLSLIGLDFLKIDVEGFEWFVLDGAKETIGKYRPVVIMETDKKFAKMRYDVADDAAEKLLLSWGYRVSDHIKPDKVFIYHGR